MTEKCQREKNLFDENGASLILLVSFLVVIAIFLMELTPLTKRIITQIEVRHAVDVATLEAVHTEVEVLSFVARLNKALAAIYAVIGADVATSIILPTKILVSIELFQKLRRAAIEIAKVQDRAIQSATLNIFRKIKSESRNWHDVSLSPIAFPRIKTKRTPYPMPGILPGFLEFEPNYRPALRVRVQGCKNNHCSIAKGEPQGENLFQETWRSKPLQ